MKEISQEVKNLVSIINAKTNTILTDEQNDVVYHFNNNMAVFANPGTGKTTTAVNGLIAAQIVHGIPGSKINAMSFTRQATSEISARYKKACAKAFLRPTVKFNTFHSICFRVIREIYPNFTTRDIIYLENELKDFKVFLKEENVDRWDDMFFSKKVYKAMNSLNNELLFSKKSVESSAKFIEIEHGITLKQFQIIRGRWFKRNFLLQSVPRGDIPAMALFILLIEPELAIRIREEFELMVVDEFQDMSVLYLEVLSIISKRLIVIGDLKQQIYGFNGASLLILDAFKEIYKDAVCLELTQSFRCKTKIVELANNIIEPNSIDGWEHFKGTGDGGTINIIDSNSFSYNTIVDRLKEAKKSNNSLDVMFLARNNASIIPIIEELYQKDIVFRTTSFSRIMDLPIFKDLCLIADIALNPTDKDKVANINKIFPEFKYVKPTNNPILEVMTISPRVSDHNLLTMNYTFNQHSSNEIINLMKRFVELNTVQKQPFSVSCLPLFKIYSEYIINNDWWKLDNPYEYYFHLVETIISKKTYESMVFDENDKANKNKYYLSMNEGVRCYTFHSSKGLEADEVYMLDVDKGILPKDKSIDDLIDKGCVLEAAKEIRNERNLLYVAVTRCKKNLTIIYNTELSELIDKPLENGYVFLDDVYKKNAVLTNETIAFKLLLGVKL